MSKNVVFHTLLYCFGFVLCGVALLEELIFLYTGDFERACWALGALLASCLWTHRMSEWIIWYYEYEQVKKHALNTMIKVFNVRCSECGAYVGTCDCGAPAVLEKADEQNDPCIIPIGDSSRGGGEPGPEVRAGEPDAPA